MSKKKMPVKIFGYDWEQIDDMQRGRYKPPSIDLTKSGKPTAKPEDIELLEKYGADKLEKLGFFGVVDRLKTSGYIKNPPLPRYRIALVRETSVKVQYPVQANTQTKMAEVFRTVFAELDREQLAVATLDTKLKVIGVNIVHMGALDQSIAHPREIMKLAVLQNASSIVVAHNHPSGDPHPSAEDRSIHTRLEAAANMLGIRYLDNLIIGDDSFFAFSQMQEMAYA